MASLDAFVAAQEAVYPQVLAELHDGHKRSHWMWFVFPQLRALGRSPTARHYGLVDLSEAHAYLAHPLLGARLRACSALLLAVEGRTAHDIFGTPDDLKLRSSMTLFAVADPSETTFQKVLDKYYGGKGDPLTLERVHPIGPNMSPPG